MQILIAAQQQKFHIATAEEIGYTSARAIPLFYFV
jgi:hypothetical protein